MFCSQCGKENAAEARFCVHCGAPLDPEDLRAVARETGHYSDLPAGVAGYGGFWRRVLAAILDALIIGVPLALVQGAITPGIYDEQLTAEAARADLIWSVVNILIWWGYSAGMHSSVYQATLGKMIMGMYVTDTAGARISFARATGRYFAEILSAMLLLIGYLMVAFTRRKQGLHDIIAGTLVLRRAR
ncbi:putative RDD family membrane protein YckC [Alkalispirillum mobile]|uniref:Putative RDD family membrane protein YckC n=1 Tax=Alkalispirillum mobile TaxID=85925 RepID=A0A498C919_9GAMM|nr:RDD family protein [Alkalispirillum mobile]RLK51687.1 putative RDD family membrane protein YckC [Alkalispirillum mobile]